MTDRTHSHDTSTPAMSAETVPSEEFVLVPREPTPEMIEAAIARELGAPNLRRALAIRSYHAMIATAPVLSASHLAKEGGEAGAVEAVAAALWREEASQGTPKSVWQARTIEAFRDTSSANQERWNRFARAALASLPQPSLALAKGGDAMRERVARIIMENRDDGACLVKDWTVEERENAHVAQALRQADAVLAALSTPTEGPASQTEGMGGGAGLVMARRLLDPDDRLGPPQPLTFPNAEWCEEYAKWHRRSVSYALTPPEIAEAVPVASDPAPATADRERLVEALRPFANAVFNDNGDMTVSPVTDYDAYVNAYFARRAALATQASR